MAGIGTSGQMDLYLSQDGLFLSTFPRDVSSGIVSVPACMPAHCLPPAIKQPSFALHLCLALYACCLPPHITPLPSTHLCHLSSSPACLHTYLVFTTHLVHAPPLCMYVPAICLHIHTFPFLPAFLPDGSRRFRKTLLPLPSPRCIPGSW